MSLTARQLSLHVRGRCLLEHIDLDLSPGEVLALIGPNGAGKSTLLALLAGDMRPDNGSIMLDNQPLSRHTAVALARRRAFLTQRHGEMPGLSVMDVLEIGLYPHGRLPADVQTELGLALRLANATDLLDRDYDVLSGGEQARVQFARVVLQTLTSPTEPRYLLLDEPTAALDLAHQEGLLAACRTLAADHRIGVLLAVHDINLAARHADRVLALKAGRLVVSGPPATALTAENICRIFDQDVLVIPHPERPGIPVFVPR